MKVKCNMTDFEWIQKARTQLENDHTLALYMVRDLKVTMDAGLDFLAWAMHQGYCVRSEVEELLDKLEAHLKAKVESCN